MTMKYSKELLEKAVKENVSYSGVMRFFGKKITGGTHSHIRKMISRHGIDVGHFTGQASNCGVNHTGGPKKKTADEILTYDRRNGHKELASRLRGAMIEKGVKQECVKCGLSGTWNNKPIMLEIHHKNGDFLDNRIDNLEFVCPNCHSQESNEDCTGSAPYRCGNCGKNIKSRKGLCGSCSAVIRNKISPPNRKRKIENRPSRQQLTVDIAKLGYLGTGRKYGVSDNCIRKWINK